MDQKKSFHILNAELKQPRLVLRLFDPITASGSISGNISINLEADEGINDSVSQYVKTPSGWYAFYNLCNRKYVFSIETSYYLKKEIEIIFPITIPDTNDPITSEPEVVIIRNGNIVVADVKLLPAPSYLFPGGSTLMRIVAIRKNNEIPVAGAEIYVKFKNKNATFVSRADESGQAVVFCNRMTKTEILQMNGFIINGPRKITISAKDPLSGETAKKDIEIKEFNEMPVILEFPE